MKIEIEIPDDDAVKLIQDFVAGTTEHHNSHGKLTVETLALMLLQDVALAVRRPGSWEGTHMTAVLTAHGYEVPPAPGRLPGRS